MRTRWLIACILCIALTIALVGAAAAASYGDSGHTRADTVSRMHDSVQALYGAATDGNRQIAYRAGQQLSIQLKTSSEYAGGTAYGWSLVNQYAASLLTKLVVGMTVVKWRPDAVRIKLAVDAAEASAAGMPQTAMWLQYKPVIAEDIGRVKIAMERQDKKAFASAEAALGTLRERADRIAGAAAMVNKQANVKSLNDSIAYAARLLDAGQRGELTRQLSAQLFAPVEAAAAQLFDTEWSAGDNHASVMAPIGGGVPHRWIFSLSSFISSLLAYVSWRKYKSSPYNVLSKQKPDNANPIILKRKV
ncbi:sporulation protein YpjB [Paenibacillus kobensis]|uniref:sporulation protein YpjB n=1 Tax=Paenibacillus kobensis TaxID=59841 RepID=UPI000FDB3BB7|nr:sporulation protein YpjB [Paenibacillus kobensis]